VALSFQFFNKSRRNIAENPQALVIVPDPDTGQGWSLRLRYVRSETTGPLFERMALRIEAIASYCGLKGIFKLRAADVYEVLSIEPVAEETGVAAGRAPAHPRGPPDPVFTMTALQDLPAHQPRRLARGARGFDPRGPRRELRLQALDDPGAGRGGRRAGDDRDARLRGGRRRRRGPLRRRHRRPRGRGAQADSHLGADARHALRARHAQGGARAGSGRPRPAHSAARASPNPESQLGVPLLVRGELVGVLCLESEVPYRFHEEDKASIELLGSYLAIAIQNMQLQERAEQPPAGAPRVPDEPAGAAAGPGWTPPATRSSTTRRRVHPGGRRVPDSKPAGADPVAAADGSRGDGRTEFTNRELRLDKSLNLPEWKDNLESRLLLLRRRLEQKCPDVRSSPRTPAAARSVEKKIDRIFLRIFGSCALRPRSGMSHQAERAAVRAGSGAEHGRHRDPERGGDRTEEFLFRTVTVRSAVMQATAASRNAALDLRAAFPCRSARRPARSRSASRLRRASARPCAKRPNLPCSNARRERDSSRGRRAPAPTGAGRTGPGATRRAAAHAGRCALPWCAGEVVQEDALQRPFEQLDAFVSATRTPTLFLKRLY
jgi:adenylate cyclase